MSMFTTQLRYVVEQTLDDNKAAHVEANWPLAYKIIGLDDYPIFDELHRETLNNKIIRHYYTREIGAETVGRFRLFVRDAMHLIMPYYNQLYTSELIAKGMEPLGDRNLKHVEHAWGNADNSATSDSTSNVETQNVFSDTPQSEMIPDQIKKMQYATTVSLDAGTGTQKGSSTSTGSYDNMVERTESGYSRSQSELLQIYRETFLNIDRSIVEDKELSTCFMTVWRY